MAKDVCRGFHRVFDTGTDVLPVDVEVEGSSSDADAASSLVGAAFISVVLLHH